MTPTTNWTARMIAAPETIKSAPRLRYEFAIDEAHGAVVNARLALSALGIVYAWLNSVEVNDDVLAPGWTSYEWRVRYTETDVTAIVVPGANTLALQLGRGWYATPLFIPPHASYGTRSAGFAELRVQFADGHVQLIASGEHWQAGASPNTSDDLYRGQSIDARARSDDWLRSGFAAVDWTTAQIIDFDTTKLEPQAGPSIHRVETLAPQKIWISPAGKILIDFGQNMVGWLRVEVRGEAGQIITVRHAEVIEHEELGVRPLRSAEATDRFTLSGGDDVFEPTLTFHGFRYCEIDGWPGGIEAMHAGGITAVVIGSDLKRTGWFRCSNDLLNQLHNNVVWSTTGNFIGVPTDCPQRDERLGWTGDIAVFAPTAAFLFDVEAFMREWLRDVVLEQAHRGGVVPWVVPDVLKYFDYALPIACPETLDQPRFNDPKPTAIWSDAIAWVPWAVWRAKGNRAILAQTFDAQLAHARKVWSLLSDRGVWEGSFQFGDWLDPEAPPENAFLAKADPHVVATQAYYRTLTIIAATAEVLGRPERDEFEEKARRLRAAFYAAYVRDGTIESDCTTVYSLAIVFDMLEPADRIAAGERLAALVRQSGHHISTGFAGTPFICDALAMAGHLDDAYAMLLQTEVPSWLYSVTMGATTIWERWDSMLPDGSINPGDMTSFNHYALGAVADWMHRMIGGIEPISAHEGLYRVAPRPGGGLRWAETIWDTPQGRLRVRWEADDAGFSALIDVPEGAAVDLDLPGFPPERLEGGSHARNLQFALGADQNAPVLPWQERRPT